MDAQPREIRIYRTKDDRSPFKEWLAKLKDRQAEARIDVRLARLRNGNLGDVKSVGEGVFELRIDYGPGYRVYFANSGETLVVLLCAGDKRTQTADIKLAKKYWNDYLSRSTDESEESDEQG
ncbi:MAG: type II toxin-antitoxin system RelE/ParE family toxin [Blastocatellia bacterium]